MEEFDAAPSVEAFDAAPSSSPPSIAEFDAAPSVDAFDATPPADPFVNAPSVSGSPSLQGGGPWASPLKPGGRGAPINEVVPAKKPGIDDFEEALRNGMPRQGIAGVVDGGAGSRPEFDPTAANAAVAKERQRKKKELDHAMAASVSDKMPFSTIQSASREIPTLLPYGPETLKIDPREEHLSRSYYNWLKVADPSKVEAMERKIQPGDKWQEAMNPFTEADQMDWRLGMLDHQGKAFQAFVDKAGGFDNLSPAGQQEVNEGIAYINAQMKEVPKKYPEAWSKAVEDHAAQASKDIMYAFAKANPWLPISPAIVADEQVVKPFAGTFAAFGGSLLKMKNFIEDDPEGYKEVQDKMDAMIGPQGIYGGATRTQGAVFADGGIDYEKVMPRLSEQMANLMIFAGAGTAGKLPLYATSYAMTHEQYFREGMEAGLTDVQASNLALVGANVQSGLEFISPLEFGATKREFGRIMSQSVKDIAKGVSTKRALEPMAKYVAKNMAKEVTQEYSQDAADLGTAAATNMLLGRQVLDDSYSMERFMETGFLTAVTTGLFSGVQGRRMSPLYHESVLWAVNKPEQFASALGDEKGLTTEQKKIASERVDMYRKVLAGLPDGPMTSQRMRVADLAVEAELLKKQKAEATVDPTVASVAGDPFKAKEEANAQAIKEALGVQPTNNEQRTKNENDGKGNAQGERGLDATTGEGPAALGSSPASDGSGQPSGKNAVAGSNGNTGAGAVPSNTTEGSTDGTVPQGIRNDGNTPAPSGGQREVPAAEATDEEAATGVPHEGKPADENAVGNNDADLAILGLAPKKKAKPAKQPVGDVPKAAPKIAEPIPPRSTMYRLIEDVSDEPQDLASAYIDDMHLYHDDGNPQSVLSALTTANVDKGSYAMFGDRNHITASFAKTYFRKRGRTVDDIAQEASDITGREITPDDVVEFMHDNPGGRPMRSERMAELADRYKEVTGKKLNKLSAKALLKKARRNPIARAAIVTGLDESDVIEHYKQAQEEWDAYTDEQKQAIFDQHEQAEKAIYEATPDEGAGEVGGSVPRGIDSQEEEERSQGEEVATPADKEREALVENLDAAKKERASFEKRFRKRGESLFDEGEVETRKDRAKGKKAEPGLFGAEGDTRANSSDDFAKAVKPYDDAVTVAQRALDEHDAGAGKRKEAAAQQTRVDEALSKPATSTTTDTYAPPKDNGAGADWHGSLKDGYTPTERQKPIIDAVQKALDAGLFYGDDIRANVAEQLGVADPSGQVFSMDVHHAERYLDAKRQRDSGERDRKLLNPKVGDQLGTLVFTDGTTIKKATLTAVGEVGPVMQVSGMKGRSKFHLTTNPGAIMAAMDRAKEKGLRADGSEEYLAAKGGDQTRVDDSVDSPFAGNKIFTADKVEAARKRLKGKFGQLNSGIDPELLVDGMTIAGAHIESGVRKFSDYAKAMIQDFGEGVKPYLLSFWEAARHFPGLDTNGMTDAVQAAKEYEEFAKNDRRDLSLTKDSNNGIRGLEAGGEGTLEGVPAPPVQSPDESGQAGRGVEKRSEPDAPGIERTGGRRNGPALGVGDDPGEVSVPAGGKAVADRPPEVVAKGDPSKDPDAILGTRPSAGNTAQNQGADFRITSESGVGEGGDKTKYRNNVAAIRVLRSAQAENRPATREEQSILAKYVGWGGLPNAFERSDASAAKGWEKEVAELKALLSPDEYKAAAASTRNAHYTSPEIIAGMWKAMQRMGFNGGHVLEPSVGVGNFLGLMPPGLRNGSQLHGVELDPITGGIAKLLYPKADIAVMGFQEYTAPDGYFDAVVGNPPFGSEKLYDKHRKDLSKFSIHNYFFAKSLDALKPGGVMAMVVTHRMMDGTSDLARKYITDRAELIGAIRLPNNAFLKNAGTSVTTDIIFLRRLNDGEKPTGEAWTEVGDYTDKDGNKVPLNEYFIRHPEMMLGEFGQYGTMYRADDTALVEKEGQDTGALLDEAISRLPENVAATVQREPVKTEYAPVKDVAGAKVDSMFIHDGVIMMRDPDSMGKQQAHAVVFDSKKAEERVYGMVEVRDALGALLQAQLREDATDAQLKKLRDRLNNVYDHFVKAHGPLSHNANRRLFRNDPTAPMVSALEDNYDKGVTEAFAKKTGEEARPPSAKKATIFSMRTQWPYKPPTNAANAVDALAATLSETGRLDMGLVKKLYGKTEAEVVEELGDLVYNDPERGWVTKDEYLSGNVKAKLAQAQKQANKDPDYRRNVKALEAVQPKDIEATNIGVRFGASWLPELDMLNFVLHILETTHGRAYYVKSDAKWHITGVQPSLVAAQKYGTKRRGVEDILEAAANQQTITIKDKGSDGKEHINQDETNWANERVKAVKEEFEQWIWSDQERRDRLVRMYNDIFNTNVERSYDGSHLQLPGKISNDIIALRPHQKSGVWRIMQGAPVLLDHVVGAGKTFTMVAGAMELRRTGMAKKPMIVVPNHLVGQWAKDFSKLYPGAKVLATNKKDFEKENRKRLFARIATGDWDAVIVAHSSFGRIQVDPKEEAAFIDEQIADIMASMNALSDQDGRSIGVKQLQNRIAKLTEQIKKKLDSGNKDDNLYWHELGVDALFVDEFHEFKNLAYSTSMQRVAGLGSKDGSNKATDMLLKIRNVRNTTGGRNVVVATGTPISNTMAEEYTLQRYLDPDGLASQGLSHFDAWARQYGEVVSDWMLNAAGKYKLTSRFAKFMNLPELQQRYRMFGDVVTRKDIANTVKVPKLKGGKPENVVVERSPFQARFIGEPILDAEGNETGQYPENSLIYRYENLKGKRAKGEDNALSLMTEARKVALDARLIDPNAPDFAGSKTNEAVKRITDIHKRTTADKGTQLVFIDLSTPKKHQAKERKAFEDLVAQAEAGDAAAQEKLDNMTPDELAALTSSFSVYDDMKAKLIAQGIPEAEIAFIHDANTDLQKEELFAKVNSGKVRVLLGSTAKMGAGMNVQERIVALHHLDAPWRPSDLEQREGRAIRQGNKLYERDPEGFELEILRYATKQTLDSRMWEVLESKANFIEQFRKGNTGDREIADIGGEAANSAEMKAAASGDPRILQEITLRRKINDMESERRGHNNEKYRAEGNIKTLESRLKTDEEALPKYEADAKLDVPAKFEMTVDGRRYDKRTEAGAAILQLAREGGRNGMVGNYGGFGIVLGKNEDGNTYVVLRGAVDHHTDAFNSSSADAVGLVTRISNVAGRIPGTVDQLRTSIAEKKAGLPRLREQVKNWSKEDELQKLKAEHGALMAQLRSKKPGNIQEQRSSENNTLAEPHDPQERKPAYPNGIQGTTVSSTADGTAQGEIRQDGGAASTPFDDRVRRYKLGLSFSANASYGHGAEVTIYSHKAPLSQGHGTVAIWDSGTGVISWANHRIDLVTKGRTMKYGHVNPALKQAVKEFIADYKHREQVARDMLRAKTEGDHPTYLRKRDELGNLVGEQRAQGYAAQLVGPKDTPTTGITHVDKVIRALGELSLGTKVHTYTNNAEYNRQAKERGGKEGQHSSAFYDNRDGSIHINLNRAKDNTLFHEAAHPVLKAVIAENPELLHGLYDQLADHHDFGKYKKFAELYEEDQRKVEAVVEYMADVAAGKARSSALPNSMYQKFKAWVKDLLNKLGFRGVKLDPANLKQFAEDFATAVTEGRKIKLRKLAEEQGTVSLQDDADRLVDGWYSRLDDAVVDKGQTMPASQWQDWVKARAKEGKFSLEEAKWTGLNDFLAEKGKAKVTPKEVRDFLKENRVEVKVEVLGSPSEGDIEAFLNDEAGQGYSREDAIEYLNKEEGATKFSAYQLPGGSNYREVLVTLPSMGPRGAKAVREMRLAGNYYIYQITRDGEHVENVSARSEEEALNKYYGHETGFRSSHFDEPNILVHLRVNDRTDADGRKVLFMEELQSDWGQRGKKEGFRRDEKAAAIEKELREKYGLKPTDDIVGNDRVSHEDQLRLSAANIANRNAVPSAPFITSTEGWVELGLKQAIRMAVDGGYDRIAWASGEQQNERYDLSKQVRSIEWEPTGSESEGARDVRIEMADDTDGLGLTIGADGVIQSVFDGAAGTETLTGKQLDDVVGKEVARRIMNDEGSGSGSPAWEAATKPESIRELGENVLGTEMASMMPLEAVDGGVMATLKHDQVRRAVVSFIPVDVVNILRGADTSAERLLSNPKVIFPALPIDSRRRVALGIVSAMRDTGAAIRAKLESGLAAGRDELLLPALKASDLNAREVAGLLDYERLFHGGPSGAPKEGASTGSVTEPLSRKEGRPLGQKRPATELAQLLNAHAANISQKTGSLRQDFTTPDMKLSGTGLKTEAQGMKGFYDKILPTVAKKVSKRLGGDGVVRDTGIVRGESRWEVVDNYGAPYWTSASREEAEAYAKKTNGTVRRPKPDFVQQSIDITPAMRERVGQGVPLMQLTDKEGNSIDPSEVAARAKKANMSAAKVREIMERSGQDEADIRAVEKAMEEQAGPNVFTMDDADMEDYFDSHFGKKAKGAAGQFSNARNAKYIFRDQAHFNTWMAERYAESDLDGMREAFAEADSRVKVAYVRDVQRRGDEHEKGWAANIGTGAPLPTGRQPVQRTTPRPLPQGGFTGGPTDAPPAGPPTPPTPPRSPSGRKKFNFTALVQLMQEFGNVPQVNRALRAALGKQKGDVTELMERLLWDQGLATEVLGHEIGHFIDRMIEVSGNRKGFARRMAPLREFSKEVNKELKDEAKALSRAWRGDFAADDKYRNSASELFADVMSALFNDPEWVNQKFPRIHDTFQDLLDGKPEFKAAYDELTDRIDGGQVADEWMRQQEEDRTKSIDEVLSPKRSSDEGIRGQLKGLFVSPWYRIMQIEGKQRNRDIGETYIDRLEISNMFHMRANAVFESDFREKVAPLLKKVDPSDADEAMKRLHWYIQANRTINERRAAGKWFEDNPSAAKELLSRLAHMEPVLRLFAPDVARLRDGQEAYDLAARMIRKVHELDRNKRDGPAVTRVAKAIDKMDLGADGDATMVAFNVRGKLLNPGGLTPETALQVVEKIRDEIGDERFAALEAAQRQLSDLLYQAQKAAADEGLISQKVFNEVIAPNRGNYAPYAVLDYWGGRVGGRMAEQVGTAKGIADTVVATQMKVAAINSWRKQQHIAKTLVDAYRSAGAEELMTIGEALDDVRDIEAIRAKHRDDDKSRLVMWVDGTPHVVEFGNDPGKSFERAHESENFRESLGILSRAPGALQATMQLYTVLTPNFWLRNIPRGLFTAMGRLGTGNVLRSTFNPTRQQKAARMAWNYAQAAHGHPMLPEVKALVENGVLAPPRFSRAMSFDAENQRILMMGGIMMGFDAGKYAGKDTAWTRSALKRHAVDKLALLSSAYEGYEKVINYLTLQAMEGITEQKAAGVAMRAGIPKGGVSGRNRMLNIGVETLMPWTRVSIQGERSALDIWRDPQLGSGYKKRLFVFEVLPRLVNLGVGMGVLKMLAGLFGDDEDKDGKLGLAGAYATAMQRVSPYKSGLDRMFPLAFYDPHTGEYTHIADWQDADYVPEHLEVVSARIPSSEEGRVWMPLLHNMVANQSPAMAIAGKGNLEILGDWATSTVTPGLNPVLELAWQAGYKMVVNGENPDDDFTHYPMANPLLFNAGWGDGRGQAIAGAVFDRTGGPGKAIGDALIGMGVMDPRAMKPASVRLKGDFTPLAEQVMFLRPFVSFDNAAPRREARVAKEASEELRGKAMSVMSPEVQELYTFYQRNKGKKDKMDARERVRLAAAGEMMKQVWGEAIVTHPNEEGRLVTDTLNLDMGRPYKMPGTTMSYHIYGRALAAAANKGSRMLMKDLRQELDSLAAPYRAVFDDPDTYIYATGDTGDE